MRISIYHKTETSANNMLAIFFDKTKPVYKFIKKNKYKADSLERIITKGKCLSALQNLNNGKLQGHDEFYNLFWSDLLPFLLNSLNKC